MKSLMNLVKFNYIEMLKARSSKIKIPTVSNKTPRLDKNPCFIYYRPQRKYPDTHSKGVSNRATTQAGKWAKRKTFFPQQKK